MHCADHTDMSWYNRCAKVRAKLVTWINLTTGPTRCILRAVGVKLAERSRGTITAWTPIAAAVRIHAPKLSDLSPDLMPAIRHLEFQPRAGLDLFHLKVGADVLQLRLGEMANPQTFEAITACFYCANPKARPIALWSSRLSVIAEVSLHALRLKDSNDSAGERHNNIRFCHHDLTGVWELK